MSLRQQNIQLRKERILNAARRILARDGAEGLSMRNLARAAQVSVTTLYNLYGSRQDIMDALVMEAMEQMATTLDAISGGDPFERTAELVTTVSDYMVAHEDFWKPMALAEAEYDAGAANPDIPRRAIAIITDILQEAIAGGSLRNELSPDILAGHIFQVISHTQLRWSKGFLDNETFRASMFYSVFMALLNVAKEPHRPFLLRQVQTQEALLRHSHSLAYPAAPLADAANS